jgi:pantoate--beta-alanine ligase
MTDHEDARAPVAADERFMKVVEDIAEARAYCRAQRAASRAIALVPTMGYLHAGHLALVERARSVADIVVATIFVNPTQFGAGEDLSTYPRDPEGDRRKLEEAGCDMLFLPRAGELYPDGFSTYVVPEGITGRYEGAFRPTHFRGVTTIVAKFFNILAPDVAVFGQKDAQQVAVIDRMIRDLNFGMTLEVVETMREPDGLAMSSRNVYLAAGDRAEALSISRALRAARDAYAGGAPVSEATAILRSHLSPAIVPDYADIIDPSTFLEASDDASGDLLAIFAGRVGRTRLIDNIALSR